MASKSMAFVLFTVLVGSAISVTPQSSLTNLKSFPTDPKYLLNGAGCCVRFKNPSGKEGKATNLEFETSNDPATCGKIGEKEAEFQPMPCDAAAIMYPSDKLVAEIPCAQTQSDLAKAAALYTDKMHEKEAIDSRKMYNEEKLKEAKDINGVLTSLKDDPLGAKKTQILKDKAGELSKADFDLNTAKVASQAAKAEAKAKYVKEKSKLESEIAQLKTSIAADLKAMAATRTVFIENRMAEEKTELATKISSICGSSDPNLPREDAMGC